MENKSNPRGFDFHCHIDLHPDPPSLIRECEERQIAVLAVTTTPKAWPQNCEWTRNCKFVHAAAGLHPELVAQRFSEIDLLEEAIAATRLIGEVGLDGSPKYRSSYSKQQEVFKHSLVLAQKHGERVITIHSRRATKDVIQAIEDHTDPSRVLCILHWFSGSLSQLRYAAELGCYFSVNSAMLRHERGVSIVQKIPKDRMLTETDFPFTSIGGRKVKPWKAIETCQEISEVVKNSNVDIKQQLIVNSSHVFKFAGIDL